MRHRIGLIWDSLTENVGDQAVGLVTQRLLDTHGFRDRWLALDPGRGAAEESALFWLAGGELLHPIGHPYYDLFRPAGEHLLFGTGTFGRPEAAHLRDYRFASVRSAADRDALVGAPDQVEISPCLSLLFPEVAAAAAMDSPGGLLIHLHAGAAPVEALAEIEGLVHESVGEVTFLSFTPYNSDFAVLGAVARAVARPLLRPRDPDEAFAAIRGARGIVCASLHATIFAYVAGIPFLALDYAEKIGRFLNERGLQARRVASVAEARTRRHLLASSSVSWDEALRRDLARVRQAFESAVAAADRGLSARGAGSRWSPSKVAANAHEAMVRLHAEHGARVAEGLAFELELRTVRRYVAKVEEHLEGRMLEIEAARTERKALADQAASLEENLGAALERIADLERTRADLERARADLERARAELLRRTEALEASACLHDEERARWHGPKVNVIVVFHRDPDLLEMTLRALETSLAVNVRAVVVRNGAEAAEVPAWVRQERWITVLDLRAPAGFARANNRGVEHGRNVFGEPEFLFFLNDDAAVARESLRWMIDHLSDHPECAIVGPRLMIWGAEDHLNSLGLNLTELGEAWDEGIGLPVGEYGAWPEESESIAVTGAALLVRAGIFKKLGGWNESYGFYFEDIDLCLRAWSAGATVRVLARAVVAHRVSATAGQQSEFKRYLSWRNQFLLLAAHWPIRRLMRLLPRLLGGQVAVFWRRLAAHCWSDAWLQLRSWSGALVRLPRVLAKRSGSRRAEAWTRFLKPPGTVPVIRLPAVSPAGRPWGAGESR